VVGEGASLDVLIAVLKALGYTRARTSHGRIT